MVPMSRIRNNALSLTFLRVLSLIDAAETARKQYDEAQLESLAGEMKQISQRLARRRPKDLLDKVVLSALRLFIFHVFEDAECNASVYSELISETETHIMQLSEDIDRVKALAILDWLLAIFMHRPTLKAQLVGIMSTTIKKVEDANSRERFTRQLSIVLDTLTQAGQTVAPPA